MLPAVGVRRTPTLAIGGRLYLGTRRFNEMARLVDQELLPGLLGRFAP